MQSQSLSLCMIVKQSHTTFYIYSIRELKFIQEQYEIDYLLDSLKLIKIHIRNCQIDLK